MNPKTADDIKDIIKFVKFKDHEFYLGTQGDNFYLQVKYLDPDVDTGVAEMQHGRKWYISRWMTKSEIVQTAFKAVLTSQEHIAREFFLYKGKRVFGPHFDVDKLAELCSEDQSLDVRE